MGHINTPINSSNAALVGAKAEDSAHTSGDIGAFSLSVVNESAASFGGSNGDYGPMSISSKGASFPDINVDFRVSSTKSPIKPEDEAFADGSALVMIGCVNNRGLTAFNATQGDAIPSAMDDYGRNINIPFSPINNYVYGNIAPTTATNTSLLAAAGGSLRNYITNLSISNTGATTSLITITDGSGGAVLWYTIAPAGSGSNIQFTVPIRTTANTAAFVTTGSASTTMYISASGFTAL